MKDYSGKYFKLSTKEYKKVYKHKGITGESYNEKKSEDAPEYLLLSESEFLALMGKVESFVTDKLQKAKRETDQALIKQKKADEQYDNAYRNAVDMYAEEVKGMNADCDKKVEEAEKGRDDALNEAEINRKKNENLLRIYKEKANAERGLTPKKKHTGYVVMVSRQKGYKWTETYGSGKKKERVTHEAPIWETVIQSPFKTDMDAKTVEEEILKNLFYVEKDGKAEGKHLAKHIGIKFTMWQKYETIGDEKNVYNICFRKSFQANYKAGYWEIVIWHTFPLDSVPKEMRAG